MILVIGPFPPPLHGFSSVTQRVTHCLQEEGFDVIAFNTAPPYMAQGLNRLSRFGIFLKTWRQLRQQSGNAIAYLPLSGGWGQLYDLFTVFLAKAKGFQSIFHHHSTAYLHSRRGLSALVFRLAGTSATHIVLCKKMQQMLQQQYNCRNVHVLSNLTFFPLEPLSRPPHKLATIGFLSNITKAKGGETMITLARSIEERGLPVKVILAGPCYDEPLKAKLEEAVAEGVLEWRGAVYGEDKAQFWHDIDAFVFPTQYENEAEPLVVWEAMAAGVPVLAYDRGCIPSQVGDAGWVIPSEDEFIEQALPVLEKWLSDEAAYREVLGKVNHRYEQMRSQAETQWENFLDILGNAV